MQKRKIAVALAFAVAIIIAVVAVVMNNRESKIIKLGTAAKGGIYNMLGDRIADLAKQKDYLLEIKNTNGSAANVRLLSEGYLDIAFAQADVVNDAYNGTGSFDKKYNGYSAVTAMYTESCHIIVRADSKVKSIGNLGGCKVNVGEIESGSRQNAYQILSAYGLSTGMYSETNYNYADACDKLKKGELDAIFVTVGAGAEIINDLANNCDIKLLGISDEVAKRLTDNYKFYQTSTIKANTYKNQAEDIVTVGVKSILLASNRLSGEQVAELLELVKAAVDIDEGTSGIPIPMHSGVTKE